MLVCAGLYWFALVSVGLYWFQLVFTFLHWSVLGSVGPRVFGRGRTGLHGAILVCLGPYWSAWGHTGVLGLYWRPGWGTPACPGLCWSELVRTGGGLTRCRMAARMRRAAPVSSGEKPMTAMASSTAR